MQLPGPVRAVIGLVAVAADEAKHLPDRAIELPMLAVSTALQASLRAQQRYARLAARGDDVLHRRPPGDDPPPWATFDDPLSAEQGRGGLAGADPDAGDRAASQLLDELLGLRDDAMSGDGLRPGGVSDHTPADQPGGAPSARASGKSTAQSTSGKSTAESATGSAAKAATGSRAESATGSAAKTATGSTAKAAAKALKSAATPAAKTPAAKTAQAAKKAASKAGKQPAAGKSSADGSAGQDPGSTTQKTAQQSAGKTINAPRHTTPSRFDTVDDA